MTNQYIELTKLVKSELNVRKTVSASADEELKASILAHGLMQNLVVVPAKKGKFHVIAGGRRLHALHSLQAEGLLPDDHAVQCQVVTEEHAVEMSLAENVVRQAMHPADQFEAFAALIEQGQTAEQVATRFGIGANLVEQRMKLAKVAPELLAEYRAENLTLNALMAFTVTDDHGRQMKIYNAVKDGWQRDNAREIRSLLTEQSVEAKNKLATFVGLETYEKAGGTVRRDLFGEDVYLENPELLNALVGEKLRLIEQELLAEGWSWVIVAAERDWNVVNGCSRIEARPVDAPQELLDRRTAIEAEIEAIDQQWDEADETDRELLDSIRENDRRANALYRQIEEEIEALSTFDPEEMKTAGCYAYISYGGKLEIEKGLVKPEDAKADRKAEGAVQDDTSADKPKGMSETLKRDLAAYRLGAAQAEIAKHPAIAFDLLVFKAAKNELHDGGHVYDGAQVSFQRNYCGNASKDASGFIREQMEAVQKDLPLDWLKVKGEAAQFAAFQSLDSEQKHQLLAFCVAGTLQPKLLDGEPKTAYDIALAQTGANAADYWRPSAANYLSRIKADQLLAIGDEIFGDGWSSHRRGAQKSALVSELDRAFATPEKALDPEKVRNLMNWLPDGMGFGQPPTEAKPAKTKKGKKAA